MIQLTRLPIVLTLMAIFYTRIASAQTAVAFPTKMNTLYIGIPNPVMIMVDGRHCKDYTLVLPGAEIVAKGNCQYEITIAPLTTAQTRMASILDSNNGIVDSARFRIIPIPDPVTDRNYGNLVRPMPLAATSLYAIVDSLEIAGRFTILDFEVTRQRGKKVTGPLINKTAQFNQEVLALLRTAVSRDHFYFESIRVKGADGYIRRLNTVRLSVE